MSAADRRRWEALAIAGTALYAAGMPLSTASVAVGAAMLTVLALLRPEALRAAAPWKVPVMGIGLVLLVLIAIRTVQADGFTPVSGHRINQYQELLLAPLLLAVWCASERARRIFMPAWIAGCAVMALRFWAALPSAALRAEMATHRISAGFVLALAAFLLVLRAPRGPRGRLHWAAAAFFIATILFAVDGRTGYVALVLLAACTAWVRSPVRWRWAAAVVAPVTLVAISLLSPAVRGRVDEMRTAAQVTSAPGETESTAIRLQLLRITGEAVREHWLDGVGYAHYGQAHEQAARVVYAGRPDAGEFLSRSWAHLTNPHDEYVLQLVGGGLVPFLFFLAWLAAAAWRAPAARAGVVLAFAAGCLFNSFLLDFMEGHAYVALLAMLLAEERARRPADAVDRIAIVATRQIGDVLLTTPLIHAARSRWPHARIDVIGFAGTLGMLRGNPEVHALVETPSRGWGGFALLRRIVRRYDLALVTDVGDRAHLLGFAAARMRSGIVPRSNPSNWWKRLLLDHVVVAAGDRGQTHVAVEKTQLLAPWAPAGPTAEIRAPQGADLPQDVAARLEPGFVVVHAPSMWPYKQWPMEHFARLAAGLAARHRQVVLTGSDSAHDQACIALLRPLPNVLDVSGRLDFAQLVTLMKRAALYIGPDTSVSHLAAAAGVPVVAIFGPTNPLRWAPLGSRPGQVSVIQSGLPCVPCGRAGCEDHRQSRSDCLADIAPERVLEAAEKVLSAG